MWRVSVRLLILGSTATRAVFLPFLLPFLPAAGILLRPFPVRGTLFNIGVLHSANILGSGGGQGLSAGRGFAPSLAAIAPDARETRAAVDPSWSRVLASDSDFSCGAKQMQPVAVRHETPAILVCLPRDNS